MKTNKITFINQKDVANALGVTPTFICDILKGKKACNEKRKKEMEQFYPNLKWRTRISYFVDNNRSDE